MDAYRQSWWRPRVAAGGDLILDISIRRWRPAPPGGTMKEPPRSWTAHLRYPRPQGTGGDRRERRGKPVARATGEPARAERGTWQDPCAARPRRAHAARRRRRT